MKTFIKLLFLLLSISLLNQNVFASEKIKIGLIVPLSGENSLIGEKIIKSTRIAINKINDDRIEIIPKDTKSNPIDALRVSKELYKNGVRIIIGPVFNESIKYLDELKNVTFISFTNKLIGNPKNVIDACKKKKIKVFCDVIEETYAKKVEKMGADAIIAVNKNAGGHAGKYSSKELINRIQKVCAIPVIAAGDIG